MIVRSLIIKLGFKGNVSKLLNFNKGVDSLKTSILALSAAFGIATAALGYFIREAAKLEQVQIAFEVMTRSIAVGRKLLRDLYTFARTTPFQIPGVIQATKVLLAMGIVANNITITLTQIGEVAAGLGKPLDMLADIFGKVKSVGYLTGFEMERLRRAGVPLTEFLEKELGTTAAEVLSMIRKKQIDFATFQKAWGRMVEERFGGLMNRLLGTVLGIWSNIKDFVFEIVTFSGEKLIPITKLYARQLLYVLEVSRKLIEIKLGNFFEHISKALLLANKGLIRIFFRTKETIEQLGGLTRVLKIVGALIGIFVGTTSLKILGWIAKLTISFLSVASLKLILLGTLLATIILALEDITGYFYGRESITGEILNALEKRYPNALKAIIASVNQLKEAWKGLTLFLYGLFTGNIAAMEAGYEQMFGGLAQKQAREQLAFKKLEEYKAMKIPEEIPDIRRERIKQATRYAAQISERQYKGIEYEQAVKETIQEAYKEIGEEVWKALPWYQQIQTSALRVGKEIVEKERGRTLRTLGIGFLRKEFRETTPLSELIFEELMKKREKEPTVPYTPFGAEAVPITLKERRPIKRIMETARIFEERKGLIPRMPRLAIPGIGAGGRIPVTKSLQINMPTTINFERIPPGLTPEQVTPIIKEVTGKEFHKNFNNILRTNWSAIQSLEE